MKNHDLTKLAAHVREAHLAHTPMRLPALTIRDLTSLVKLLGQPAANDDSKTIH